MGIGSNFGISGHLKAFIKNEETGQVREYDFDNTLTQFLLNRVAKWLAGVNNTGYNATLPPTKFQLGTGTGTAAVSDTNLFTPAASSLVSISTSSANSNVTTYIINYPTGSLSGTYTEAGLLDANNVLLTHLILSPTISISSNESALFQYTLTTNA